MSYTVRMFGAARIPGVVEKYIVGLKLRGSHGAYIRDEPVVEFGVFDEAGFLTPHASHALDDAQAGQILSGYGGPMLKVKVDQWGMFKCILTKGDTTPGYLTAWSTPGGIPVGGENLTV